MVVKLSNYYDGINKFIIRLLQCYKITFFQENVKFSISKVFYRISQQRLKWVMVDLELPKLRRIQKLYQISIDHISRMLRQE